MAIPQGQAAKRLQDILQGLEAQIEQLAEEASIKKAQIDLDSATKMSDLEQAKQETTDKLYTMLAQKPVADNNFCATELIDLTSDEDNVIKIESNTKQSPVNEQLPAVLVQHNGLPDITPASPTTESAQPNRWSDTTAASTVGSATADAPIAVAALSPPAELKSKTTKRSQRVGDAGYETHQPKPAKGCVVRGPKSSRKYSPVVEKYPMIISDPEGPGLVQLRCKECGSNQAATGKKTFYAGGQGYLSHYNMCHPHFFRAGTGLVEIVRYNTEKKLSREEAEQAYAGTYYVEPKASVGRPEQRVARVAEQMSVFQQENPEADRFGSKAGNGLGPSEANASAGVVESTHGSIKIEMQE
ncbi:hypothetical protein LTR37_004530 [Vermiconidia calcicola]|uniref:Uncharacterized protein n=1 Tax=Vermiconidia calcicola TaxID=1690605 RepID=A0ACC3NML1_9PEZI|nr:hypothetical protein LTR37_004530 [Vermiconidia calcicola]